MTRPLFEADWAFAFQGLLEKNVRASAPRFLRSWPLLQSFDAEAFLLRETYIVIVMRDKLSGVPTIGVKRFPDKATPSLPPNVNEIPLWQFFLDNEFNLSASDVAFLVPVHDSGASDPTADYALFTPQEKYFWAMQLQHIVNKQLHWVSSLLPQSLPSINTVNISGSNARLNIGSTDSSTNVVGDNSVLFSKLRDCSSRIPDETKRGELARSISEMEVAAGSPGFVSAYQRFVALAADHAGLFGSLLPALSLLLGG